MAALEAMPVQAVAAPEAMPVQAVAVAAPEAMPVQAVEMHTWVVAMPVQAEDQPAVPQVVAWLTQAEEMLAAVEAQEALDNERKVEAKPEKNAESAGWTIFTTADEIDPVFGEG